MKRALISIAIFLFLIPTHLAAQAEPASVFLDFHTSGSQETYDVVALRNTRNNSIFVFFNVDSDLYFQTVSTDGTISSPTMFASNSSAVIEAAWSKENQCYLIVYRKAGAFYARAIKFFKLNGLMFVTDERFIANVSTSSRVRLAAAKKGKFVLFINDGTNLSAIALNDDGKIFKKRKMLTNVPSGELRIGGADREGKKSVAYVLFTAENSTKSVLSMVKVNNKLGKVQNKKVAVLAKPADYYSFVGKYDPDHRLHTAVVGDKYCTFKKTGRQVLAMANLPTQYQVRDICYDPVEQCFGLLTADFYEDPNTFAQGADIYMSTYDSQGTFIMPETLMLEPSGQEANPSSFRMDYAPNGNYMITYALEMSGLSGMYYN